ncbi:tetratricopeptide repeat protein [Erythrobacter sp. LQ02-29]|uniref:tetratricopeptide repeat protein n=1 Tax=Erythrobacter sp. LQ02-29 TaxID=2920384 RepID=UPI001F4D4D68|nr:tetratricopeptide repeat protein [Erythrobacter sp. LQ02-29]MCP9223584.1 tetratricopeptide repeat protein [Erythrobacter sp. LQ02-29]
MSWVAAILLAGLGFLGGATLLRRERGLWTLFAAALVFGLAGFAWQASPALPSAPGQSMKDTASADTQMMEARREFFSATDPRSRYVLTADAFARRGRSDDAAGMLHNAVQENPSDGEAWLALATVLVEHAGGRLAPPSLYAFERAQALLPGNPGPAYFLGIAALREGRFEDTREIWAQGVAQAKPGAPGRDLLAMRLAQLDEIIAAMSARGTDALRP